jgi:hypothetical protein
MTWWQKRNEAKVQTSFQHEWHRSIFIVDCECGRCCCCWWITFHNSMMLFINYCYKKWMNENKETKEKNYERIIFTLNFNWIIYKKCFNCGLG